jgi:hypothetical protein
MSVSFASGALARCGKEAIAALLPLRIQGLRRIHDDLTVRELDREAILQDICRFYLHCIGTPTLRPTLPLSLRYAGQSCETTGGACS